MAHFTDPAPGSYRRWVIFIVGSLNFVLSMFYRVSTAVISPALIRDLDMTTSQLSDLSAAFYYAFALSQVPLGVALDRIGPRLTMCFLSVAAVGGAVVFAIGKTPDHLILARVLLGVGMSGNMMVPFALLAVWFPVDRFGFLSGIAIAVGSVGNLLAATPLALLSLSIGWRASFLLFAAVNAVIVVTFIIVMRDYPPGYVRPGRRAVSVFTGLGRLARMYGFWAISLTNFVRYGYFAALQSLWLGPFIILGMGLGEVVAGNALLCMGMGYMVGLPVWGWASDRFFRSRKRVVLPTMICFCLTTFSLVTWTQTVPTWVLMGTFLCIGLLAAPGQILYAHIKELLPTSMVGQAMTSVNFFTVLGVGVMIHVLGLFLGSEPGTRGGPQDFLALWYVGVVALGFVSLLYAAVPDSTALRLEDS